MNYFNKISYYNKEKVGRVVQQKRFYTIGKEQQSRQYIFSISAHNTEVLYKTKLMINYFIVL